MTWLVAHADDASRLDCQEKAAVGTQESAGLMQAVADVVAGRPSGWTGLAGVSADGVCAFALEHGVLPLMAERAAQQPAEAASFAPTLRERAGHSAAMDLMSEVELCALLTAMADAGLRAVLFKGAHLAYMLYARPDLRPREDTDLLIDARDRAAFAALLDRLGYAPIRQVAGDLVTYQTLYVARRAGVTSHRLDLHWRVSNPQRFGDVLTFDALIDRAVPLPRLHAAAVGPAPVDALVLACVHRVAHHYDVPMLIWSYDIHLLSIALTSDDWKAFADLAVARRVAAVCHRSLDECRRWFATEVPASVLARLGAEIPDAAVAAYLAPGQRHVRRILADLQSLPSWADRGRLLGQHLFPPVRYMREVYAPGSAAPVVVLYARRVWRGARRWLARS